MASQIPSPVGGSDAVMLVRDSGPKSVVVTSLIPKRLMRTERARGDSGLEMNGAFRDKTWGERPPEPAVGKRPPYSQHLHHHGYCLLTICNALGHVGNIQNSSLLTPSTPMSWSLSCR